MAVWCCVSRPPARLLTLLSYTNSSSPHKYRRISVSLWCLLIKQIDSLYPRQILCLSVSYTKRMIYPFAYNTVRLRWPRGSSVSKFHHHLCTDLCVIICCWEKKRERRHGLGRAGLGWAGRCSPSCVMNRWRANGTLFIIRSACPSVTYVGGSSSKILAMNQHREMISIVVSSNDDVFLSIY